MKTDSPAHAGRFQRKSRRYMQMSVDREDLKKGKTRPHGLRKLAPNDFDEEMSAIKNGLHHVGEKFQKSAPVAEGSPFP